MARELPGVSFVVPVYNKAPYLQRVLAAMFDQAGDFEREFIFIDDGSTDGSLDLLRRLTAGRTDVVIESRANHGSAHATNCGIARARLPFIKFVDADDLLARHATATLLAALAPSDACLAYGDVVRYAGEAEVDLAAHVAAPRVERLDSPLRAALRNSLFNPTQFLVRSDCAKAVGGCDERIVHSQEYSLTLRLAQRWPFLRVRAPTAFLPGTVPGSLGTNRGQQLKRVTMACAHFVRDHPEVPDELKRFACRRAAGRAWKYARRSLGAGHVSRWFWLNLRSYLPMAAGFADFIETCAGAFDAAPARS
jgi:glycosyltransferase involved in cell wall biosynthesis